MCDLEEVVPCEGDWHVLAEFLTQTVGERREVTIDFDKEVLMVDIGVMLVTYLRGNADLSGSQG